APEQETIYLPKDGIYNGGTANGLVNGEWKITSWTSDGTTGTGTFSTPSGEGTFTAKIVDGEVVSVEGSYSSPSGSGTLTGSFSDGLWSGDWTSSDGTAKGIWIANKNSSDSALDDDPNSNITNITNVTNVTNTSNSSVTKTATAAAATSGAADLHGWKDNGDGTYSKDGVTLYSFPVYNSYNLLQDGTVYGLGYLKYQIIKSLPNKKTSKVIGIRDEYKATVKKVNIPANTTLDGYYYGVIQVGNKAFKANSLLKKVVIGKKIKVIGKAAFLKDKNVKKFVIKAKKLKKIKKKAFAKLNKKVKIKVPKKLKKKYTKLLKKAGLNTKLLKKAGLI
ncbi:MAG: leucine-rich repeat protein, partial [Lachnospiraceae bacterium]|nr:leucine-rich repeat protein [Lachnospiraceae bacterium]